MTTIYKTFHKTFGRAATCPRRFLDNVLGGLLLPPLLFALGACNSIDDLLEVELPGRVQAEDLVNPTFATTLMLSARGDFECALSNHIWSMGIWTLEFYNSNQTRTQNVVSLRDTAVKSVSSLGSASAQPNCRESNPPPLASALHIARVQGKNAVEIISGFDEAEVPEKNFNIGVAYAYRGYSVELLSEAFCAVTFDSGPIMTREQGFDLARGHFLEAIDFLGRVTSGPNVSEAQSVENMAKIGYARASLQLGDAAGVVRFRNDVPEGFVRFADRSTASTQTRNWVGFYTGSATISVYDDLLNLEVEGVPDPRVPVRDEGRTASDNISPLRTQLKYTSQSDDIPFATWRELQISIAEAEGGQAAVDIINQLRTNTAGLPANIDASAWPLPQFASNDPAEIRDTVIEERRRELWLQGIRIGDMLRNDIPFVAGTTPKGEVYGPFTCVPLEEREEVNNPNILN